jgi:alpha/beta superfamily hydrolase
MIGSIRETIMATIEPMDIPAPHGLLEGLLRVEAPAAAPRLAAVVCHPHPLGQGTMHNKVVFTLAKALNAAGVPALRFNFRGVGRSTGAYANGLGEAEDVRTALGWLAARYPDVPLLLAGFSFGAWVGLPVGCADARVTHLIGAGIPTASLDVASLADCHKPKLIVQGGEDEYGPRASLETWFAGVAEPKTLHIIDDTSHFFTNKLDALAMTVTAWARQHITNI